MVDQPRLSKRDKEWRAEDDARALAQAKLIANDPARLDMATKAALRMAEKEREEAAAMTGVSKMTPSSSLKSNSKPDTSKAPKAKAKPKPKNPHNVFKRI